MASAVIYAIGTQSGNQPRIRRINEKNAQLFQLGVPVMLDAATGSIKEWDGVTIAGGIAGVSKEPGHNLAATGVKQFVTTGDSVPNQPQASAIARGAPYNDGRTTLEVADSDIMYFAQVGPAQLALATDLGQNYGMTKDGDGHWYVDKNKVGAAAVCQVVKIDQFDTRGVWIAFLPAVQQIML